MSASACSLVNDSQRIAMVRQDKRNADGSYYLENGHRVAENVAYAWNADGTVGERVVWVHQLQDGRIVDAWLSIDQTKKWNPQTQLWETL